MTMTATPTTTALSKMKSRLYVPTATAHDLKLFLKYSNIACGMCVCVFAFSAGSDCIEWACYLWPTVPCQSSQLPRSEWATSVSAHNIYEFQDLVCVPFCFYYDKCMASNRKKGFSSAKQKMDGKTSSFFTIQNEYKFNATEIFCFSSAIPIQKIWPKSNRNAVRTADERKNENENVVGLGIRWSVRDMFVRENKRMIQLIFFYCIRHEMTHKYQLFSAVSLLLHCGWGRLPIRPLNVFGQLLFMLSLVWCSWSVHFRIWLWFSGKWNPKIELTAPSTNGCGGQPTMRNWMTVRLISAQCEWAETNDIKEINEMSRAMIREERRTK